MRYLGVLAGLVLWANAVGAQTVTPGAQLPAKHQALEVHVSGRVAKEAVASGISYKHQWPGVYFETAFSGDRIFLSFDDPHNEYRLHIDALAPISIDRPRTSVIEVSGLTKGKHTVRLEKLTESISDRAAFNGFYVTEGNQPLPVTHRARQIEFIGDSGMVGYGNRSTRVTCTWDEVRKFTDTQQAWPALVAKSFGADYQVNAISGRGVVRNFNGTTPGFTMSDIYPFTFFDKTVPYAAKDWNPQVVLLALGGNDMTPLQPGEPWKNMDELGVALVEGYARLVVSVHQRYPDAAVVMQWPGPTGDPASDHAVDMGRKSIEAAAQGAGLKRLVFMIPPKDFKVELTGCDYHGSLKGHKDAAAWSIDWFNARPELWQGK